ncbi:MAG: hypothetical protein QXO93_02410 [Acidilobaceae archaeon]
MAEERSDTEQELLNTIEDIRDKIINMKDERRKLIEEIKRLRDERRRLVDERRKLASEYRGYRDQLRAIREEFLKLKEERDRIREEALNKREDLRIARQLAEKEGDMARVSLRRLQRRLEELEWRQMTTVMRPEEEKRIIDEIARIESMIMKVREARKHVISVLELQADYKSTLIRLKDLNSKLAKLVEEIARLKNKLNEIGGKIWSLNKQIDELTSKINEKSSRVDGLSREIDELYGTYKDSLTKLKEFKEARRLGLQLEILERKRREIKEKAERGEPLTLEELRILYGELES